MDSLIDENADVREGELVLGKGLYVHTKTCLLVLKREPTTWWHTPVTQIEAGEPAAQGLSCLITSKFKAEKKRQTETALT